MIEREQNDVFETVSWCILGTRGKWERLPVDAHFQLESRNVAGCIRDAQGHEWAVNLSKMEAKETRTGLCAKLKRLENLPGTKSLNQYIHWYLKI